MKYGFVLAFLLLAIIQWVIPGKTIWEKDRVLKEGKSYKFRTEPVDPSNPFKGKYIVLNFAENSFTDTVHRGLRGNERVYVILIHDSKGFAKIKDVLQNEPKNT